MRIVIESPLGADTPEGVQRNYRFLLWILRAVWLRDGHHAIASHLICPFFMDDDDPAERTAGIGWEWMWDRDVPHWFWEDCGLSRGMLAAEQECRNRNIGYVVRRLRDYHPASWAAFERGEWPPHTKGVQLAAPVPDDVVHWDEDVDGDTPAAPSNGVQRVTCARLAGLERGPEAPRWTLPESDNDDVVPRFEAVDERGHVSYAVDTSAGIPVPLNGGRANVDLPALKNHVVGVPANVYAVPPTNFVAGDARDGTAKLRKSFPETGGGTVVVPNATEYKQFDVPPRPPRRFARPEATAIPGSGHVALERRKPSRISRVFDRLLRAVGLVVL